MRIPTISFPEDPVHTGRFTAGLLAHLFSEAFPFGNGRTVAVVQKILRGLQQRGLLRIFTGFPY